jgi:hypothetical protein
VQGVERVNHRGGVFVLELVLVAGLAVACAVSGPSSRTRLDARWDQAMREGRSVTIKFRNSTIDISENPLDGGLEDTGGRPEAVVWTKTPKIIVLEERGFWHNGGWELVGGLLGRAVADSSSLELWGKAAVQVFPYFPFPFHREIPHETGYEFFLLLRQPGSTPATVVRQWAFKPNEVVVTHATTGGNYEDVRAVLKYNEAARTATVAVSGLKRPFEDRLDLSRPHR